MKRKAEQAFESKEVDPHHEGNEVNFGLPPKFDEFKDEQEEIEEEEKKKGRAQKGVEELKQKEIEYEL